MANKEKKVSEKVCPGDERACKDCKGATETKFLRDLCNNNGCPAREVCDKKLCPETLGIPCCVNCQEKEPRLPLFVIFDFNRD